MTHVHELLISNTRCRPEKNGIEELVRRERWDSAS